VFRNGVGYSGGNSIFAGSVDRGLCIGLDLLVWDLLLGNCRFLLYEGDCRC